MRLNPKKGGKGKKGISPLIGYVLLVVFAVVISSIVFQWLRTYVPAEAMECPDGVSLFLNDATFDDGELDLTMTNNGRFSIDGYFINIKNDSEQDLAVIGISEFLTDSAPDPAVGISGYVLFEGDENSFEPQDQAVHIFDLPEEYGEPYSVSITPIRRQEHRERERLVSCGNARVEEIIGEAGTGEEEPDYSWDISYASYDSIFLSTQDSSPRGLFFKSDGTKIYEIGAGSDRIYQYTCTTAWDLSSCSYDSVYISTQDNYPTGLSWKSDGTKLYEIGYTGDKFYQYSCNSAWDLSSCNYDSVYISTQDGTSGGLFFKSDGTKLYEIGYNNKKIWQYNCGTAWDLSSCSYSSVSISTQDIDPEGLFFSSDGSKLYESGKSGNKFYQYNCSTPWSLSSCSYDSVYISTQDNSPSDLFFKSNGLKLYEIGYSGDKIYQYSLSD